MLRAKEPCPWSLDVQDDLIKELERERTNETIIEKEASDE
jgi:hypothetical protein